MLIEPWLGYKSTWRILSLLLETPRKPVSRTELFNYTKLGNAPLSKGLGRLVSFGLVILEKRGKKQRYYINERSPLIKPIRDLWMIEKDSLRNLPYGLNLILNEFIRSLNEASDKIEQVYLFGSQAKGTATIHSDIDLAVIFKNNLKQEIAVTRIVNNIEKQFAVKIQVHFFTENIFSSKTRLVEEIKNSGIKLIS